MVEVHNNTNQGRPRVLDGTVLRETLQAVLPRKVVEEQSRELGVIERVRKCEVYPLITSLVLSSGSDDSGRLADAYRRYKREASQAVVRGGFYYWMDDETADLLERLLDLAIDYAASQPVYLPGRLSGVEDWISVDSETITLRPALAEDYPATSTDAGIKVHKELSLGRGCMVGYELSPAREHDSIHLKVDERYRGKGLLVDLGYPSLKFINDCDAHDVKYVIRLKDNWKPKIQRVVRGEHGVEVLPGTDLDDALNDYSLILDGRCIDADVVLGQGEGSVATRMVAISLPANENGEIPYLFFLTNLSRRTHGPNQIAELYRVRWEIECDNKLDKSGSRLDQIRATKKSSVRILLYSALLHSLIVDLIVHHDILDRVQRNEGPQAPLHRLLVAHALRAEHVALLIALLDASTPQSRWDRIAASIDDDGRDPNWRRRPSVLDKLLGQTAPPGRPRRKKLRQCSASAAPYRRTTQPAVSL